MSDGGPGWKDRLKQRLPFLRTPLEVQERYGELHGNHLAAAVTFQMFLSLLPLLLVIVAVAGFVAASGSVDVADRIISSLGLHGEAAAAVRDAIDAASDSRQATSVFGVLGLAWAGLGLVSALQYGYNQVWQVEDRGLKDRLFGLLWLGGAAVLFVGTAAVTTVLQWLPGLLSPLAVVLALLANFGLWLWSAKVLPNRDVGWRPLVPGALLGAVGLEVLKLVGAVYVPNAVASSSGLYGALGVFVALVAWLLFFGRLVVYSAVLNVLLYERRHGTRQVTVAVPDLEHEDGDRATRVGRLEEVAP